MPPVALNCGDPPVVESTSDVSCGSDALSTQFLNGCHGGFVTHQPCRLVWFVVVHWTFPAGIGASRERTSSYFNPGHDFYPGATWKCGPEGMPMDAPHDKKGKPAAALQRRGARGGRRPGTAVPGERLGGRIFVKEMVCAISQGSSAAAKASVSGEKPAMPAASHHSSGISNSTGCPGTLNNMSRPGPMSCVEGAK
jgi:hypothetical protein